jgi:asparagine synthase (glutamine-hydrolysing)
LSAQALALYFTTGYVPQGFTLYEEIVSCENASKYIYRNGRVIKEKLFEPVEVDQAVGLGDLRYSIEQEVAAIKSGHELIDVWCSGGLDSAIMVHCFNEGHQNPTGILTLGYDSKVRESFGDGELRFVQDLAAYYKVDFQRIDLTEARYNAAYQQMVSAHISPVVDIVAPPKYALASATREMAITGEGGDPLFSGVKNNMVLYALKKNSTLSFGEIYALAHQRLFHELGNVLEDGTNLIDFVIEYFNKQYSLFPGDTNRRLFYLNTFLKQGGMIFPKNYYAAKRNGIAVRHPLTALNVYRTAFSLSDDQKYIYPKGKLALISLYKDSLPKSVIERKKSGTRLPLDFYLDIIMKGNEGFDFLQNTGMFNAEYIGSIANKRESSPLLLYGLQVLNDWLIHNGGYQHATTNLPAEARNIQSPSISGGVQRASG